MNESGLRILAVLVKEFRQLARDRLTYAMILVLPIVQLMLFGYVINSDPKNLPAMVLMQDRGVLARSMVPSIANTGYVRFVAEARSPADIDRALDEGRVQLAVTIPDDFS